MEKLIGIERNQRKAAEKGWFAFFCHQKRKWDLWFLTIERMEEKCREIPGLAIYISVKAILAYSLFIRPLCYWPTMVQTEQLKQYAAQSLAELFATFLMIFIGNLSVAQNKFKPPESQNDMGVHLSYAIGVYVALMVAGPVSGRLVQCEVVRWEDYPNRSTAICAKRCFTAERSGYLWSGMALCFQV